VDVIHKIFFVAFWALFAWMVALGVDIGDFDKKVDE